MIVRDDGVREEVASCVYAGDNVRGAALVVAIVVGRKGPTAFDAGRAAQNMMLAASNDGIGSCPNGIAEADRLREALEHGEDEQVATVLTFGYPQTPRRDPQSLAAEEWVRRRGPPAVRGDRQGDLEPVGRVEGARVRSRGCSTRPLCDALCGRASCGRDGRSRRLRDARRDV